MRVYTRKIREFMWAMGMPTDMDDDRFANIFRACLKAGLTNKQATAIVKDAFRAAKGYEWDLPQGSMLHRATQEAVAAKHPRGKCAEDLAAEHEGRPSRWGTPEFHRAS